MRPPSELLPPPAHSRTTHSDRRIGRLVAAFVVLVPALAAARQPAKVDRDGLLQLQTPNSGQPAAAHPFVNVIVRFGTTSTNAPADPASFRVKLGSRTITTLFADDIQDGQLVGKRARLPADLLQLKSGKNVLKLRVRSIAQDDGTGTRRSYRDGDRVKFRAAAKPNTAPVAAAAASATVIAVDTPITFAAAGSHDDDQDELTFQWNFGDGSTATGKQTSHRFDATDEPRTVTLSVSDGQATTTQTLTLRPPPPVCDPNVLPGILAVEGSESLELGAVPLGQTATRTFLVRNRDPGPSSQIKLRIDVAGAGFSADPTEVILDAGASMPIRVQFSPSSGGHVAGQLTVLPCDPTQPPVALLAHGYGGDGPASGPSLAGAPVFANRGPGGLEAWLPAGARVPLSLAAGHCERRNGASSGDLCVADRDCSGTETCSAPSGPLDVFDLTDFCGDGQGSLYVLAAGSVNDPEGLVTGSLVRFGLDDGGAITSRRILRRITEDTDHIACDRVASDAGSVFVAERHPTNDGGCVREEREAFTAVQKTSGDRTVVGGLDRIDAFEVPALDACDDDLSAVDDLQVTPDGGSAYFIGSDTGGVYRLRPRPAQILRYSSMLRTDQMQIHPRDPNGALLYAASTDLGTTSRVQLYLILPEQAENGALRLEDLTPCASYAVPNQRAPGDPRPALTVTTFAAGPAAGGAGNSTVLVGVADTTAMASPLGLRGTVAFDVAADASGCTALGITNLELSFGLRF